MWHRFARWVTGGSHPWKGRRDKNDRCWFCLGREGCPLPCDFCPEQKPLPQAIARKVTPP